MQTFLPYPNFEESAKCLDYKRLGKERLEAMQILNCLLSNRKAGWKNHPAVRMWEGYEEALKSYMNAMIREWLKRGYRNTMKIEKVKTNFSYPIWVGDNRFHSSHRQTLLFKNYEWYKQFRWEESPKYEYFWPVELIGKRK